MRQIKFRVWDPTNKRMIRFDHNDLDDYYLELDFWNDTELVTIEEKGGWQPYMNKEYVEGAILLQYTGLKDKNDKEIYEGDIIQFTVNKFSGNGIEKIVKKGDVYYTEDMTLSVYGWILARVNSREVIGNIYENPELLEQSS